MTRTHSEVIQEPIKCRFLRTKDTQHPENSNGFRSSVPGTRVKDQILERKFAGLINTRKKKKDSPSTLNTEEITKILEALCQESRADAKYIFTMS